MSDTLLEYIIDYSLSYDMSIDFLENNSILPLKREELYLIIATSNKQINTDEMLVHFQNPIKFIFVEELSLCYELQNFQIKLELYKLAIKSLDTIYEKDENSYIILFLDKLFSFCISTNVSDIHFESLDKSIVIRIRIDGELNQIFRFDYRLFSLISSVIKYFGNLDISQKRKPLNGRISREIQDKVYDMRISTMPTIHGESIVLRILDNGNIQKDIQNIGFDKDTLTMIQNMIRLNQGLILVTGPTGSGKTTSLYSMINCLNTKNKKIITIEDPVEYKLDGVMQISINNEIGLDYKTVLKNVLRQDPDILLIGEIRDTESLQIAIQASLTGHLVLATLHTNSSLETITRLLDLDAKAYLIASTLKMVMSQRLVRVLCSQCKEKINGLNEYTHKGCISCNFTGYKNRTIVSEILFIDDTISKMIAKSEGLHEIESYVKKSGFLSLQEKGLQLVKNGITTLDEFYSKI